MSNSLKERLKEVGQIALEKGYVQPNYSLLPVNGRFAEPEAKIDFGYNSSYFIPNRLNIAEGSHTLLLPETINMGSHGMVNFICEADLGHTRTPFYDAGKFFRIAARVGNDGKLYDTKIAVKSLSRHTQNIEGIALRDEFELPLPNGLTLEEGIQWFFDEYRKIYGFSAFDEVAYGNIKPIAGYMSARTGFIFLQKSIICEACEDLMVPMGADMTTPLADPRTPEVQFEWENIGYLHNGIGNIPSDHERFQLAQRSMINTRQNLIRKLWPDVSDIDERCTYDSKAEIAVERTLNHEHFAPYFFGSKFMFNAIVKSEKTSVECIVKNGGFLKDMIVDPQVIDTYCRIARNLEKQREQYNGFAPKDVQVCRARTLAA